MRLQVSLEEDGNRIRIDTRSFCDITTGWVSKKGTKGTTLLEPVEADGWDMALGGMDIASLAKKGLDLKSLTAKPEPEPEPEPEKE